MKVLRPNSIILGIRKLWRIFPIKQKFDTTAAFFFIVKTFKTRPICGYSFWPVCNLLCNLLALWKHWQKIVKFDQIEHFGLSKKAAVVSNFTTIFWFELGCKTFMPIQTLDLHRVKVASNSELRENQWNDLLFFEIVPSHCFGASEVQT